MSGDDEGAIAYPFSGRTRDLGWRRLFDLAAVGPCLRVFPGDRVLEVGAGTGYGSEMLARFGCRTVSLDLSAARLAACHGRRRVDGRLGDSCVWHSVAGDGRALPFPAQVFHGALCLHALHHVEDVRGFLGEVARVLVPGGRACFAEPGVHHGKSYEARLSAERTGERELAVDPGRVHEIARAVGFARMEVLPLPYPRDAALPYEGSGAFGEAWRRRAGAGWAHWLVHEYRALFTLVRTGRRPVDSRAGEGLRARLDLSGVPETLVPGATFEIAARAANAGDAAWLSAPSPWGGHVRFGARLLTAAGRVMEEAWARQDLPRDVPPGEAVDVTLLVRVPPDLAPGEYRLRFDMVSESVAWFSDVDPAGGAVETWARVAPCR